MLQEAEEFAQKKFSHAHVDHPFLRELFRICTLRRAQQMALQKTSGSEVEVTGLEAAPTAVVKSVRPVEIRYKDLVALLEGDVGLASLPHIFTEINRVISDPRSSAIHVADVISKDPNLASKLLRIVNSAFYGFPSKIDTISRAVTILGSRQFYCLCVE